MLPQATSYMGLVAPMLVVLINAETGTYVSMQLGFCREVWVVMPLMDCGTLAAAVRAGAFEAADGSINAVSCHAP